MSNNVCADQHKLARSKLFKDIEIPPRKLLLHNKKKSHHHHHQEIITSGGSPGSCIFDPEEMNNLHKFLPFNNTDADSDPDSDPYADDHFRMYEFKIRRCSRSRSHDWTDCPFAHPGEKARRRDPRRHQYSGTVCSEYRRGGGCSHGDDCEFAHGVFECWLHPSRYRTEACKDGKNCKRKVCFFAHSPRQLRILPQLISSSPTKYSSSSSVNKNHCCCMYCHDHHCVVNSSPTSTLMLGNIMSHLSRSPSLSPPLSPVKHGYNSPVTRYTTTDRLSKFSNSEMSMSYKDVLNELMRSLDAMSFNEVSISSPMSLPAAVSPWNINVNSLNVDQDQQQQQFVLSPSIQSPSGSGSVNSPLGHADHHLVSNKLFDDDVDDHNIDGVTSTHDPDLGWVNDLLM